MSLLIDLDLEVGAPVRCGPMSLFPLVKPGLTEAIGYSCGPLATGDLLVDEQPGGVVAELITHNQGDQPVLLIEGETLLGAKQDRVLNVSVLLAADQATTVPVSCVEAGRWGSVQPSRRSASHAPTSLRARKTRSVTESARTRGTRRSDQGGVWEEVATYNHDYAAASPTSALRDVQAAAAQRVDSVLPATGPALGQVGVIVAVGGRPTVLELFEDPATFEAYWYSLVNGYALDAARSGRTDDTTPERAEALLATARNTTFEVRPGVSLGEEVQAETEALVASGITWEGRLLHLACFATG